MIVMCLSCLFLKPFLKGKILQTRKGGKLDFEHHFAFLTNFLKTETFLLSGIFFSSSRGSFSKKICPKRTFPSYFVYLFVLLQLCPILDYFFLIQALIELRKMLIRETRICAGLGLHIKFKTLFMSGHHFDLPLFFNMSKQFLAPGGLSAECVQIRVM